MFRDLLAILKGDGIALDKEEAEALGAPAGDTISLWAAMQSRHGSAFAHLVCAALFLVQRHHCRDQLAGIPMKPQNYVRAVALLILFAPFAALIWALRSFPQEPRK